MTDKRDRQPEKTEKTETDTRGGHSAPPVEVELKAAGIGLDGLVFSQLGPAAQATAIDMWRATEKNRPANPLQPEAIDAMSDTEVRQVILAEGHRFTLDGMVIV